MKPLNSFTQAYITTALWSSTGYAYGDWPEPAATKLTEACKAFGEVWLYVGDDGRIYASGGEWSGSPDLLDPDNFWIDDQTGERVNAATGERTPHP